MIPPLQQVHLYVVSNVVQTVHLSAIAVPSSAGRFKGIAQEGSTGKIYVTDTSTATGFPGVSYIGGMKVRQDGAILVADTAPTVYLGGLGFTDDGTLCAIDSGTAADFNAGVPMLNGKVRVSGL